jgi:hypothetical protein
MNTKTVYQTSDGVYVGETLSYESPLEPGKYLLPAGCVEEAPPDIPEGHVAIWDGKWTVVKVPEPEPDPIPIPIPIPVPEPEPEPVPEPEPYPEPDPFTVKERELMDRMFNLDLKSIRPLRTIKAGVETDEDLNMLKVIENDIKAVRVELAALRESRSLA